MSPALKRLLFSRLRPHCGDEDVLGTDDRPIDVAGREDSRSRARRAKASLKVGTRRYKTARGITVDSGAADNVLPRRMVRGRGNRIRPSAASRAGVHYVTASANSIPNEGETELSFDTSNGRDISWLFQVAEVNKVLASVSFPVDHDHRVVFDRDERTGEDTSFILNKKTGACIKMRRDRQVWVVDAYVEEEVDPNTESSFARQD